MVDGVESSRKIKEAKTCLLQIMQIFMGWTHENRPCHGTQERTRNPTIENMWVLVTGNQ